VAGDLRLAYSQFEELETFARFATRLDDDTRATIERGRRVREVLKQPEHAPLPVLDQLVVLRAMTADLFDTLPLEAISRAERAVQHAVRDRYPELDERLASGDALDEAVWREVVATMRDVIASQTEGSSA
jgi:F-type H+-transporting ATPase subunit alpha